MSWNEIEIPIADSKYFETLNGLWKGKNEPFVEAGVIRNTNFTPSGLIDYADVAYLDVEVKQLLKRRLEPGDIILERSGGGPKQPVGRVVFFDREDGDFSFSNFTSAVRVKDRAAFDPRFVFYGLMELYQSGRTEDIQRRTTGIRNLDFAAYKERARFPKIPLPEQKKIAYVLSTVQRAIEAQERIIQTTTELKKALMRKLFTEGLRGERQKQTEIGPVPESWEVTTVGNVAAVKGGKRLPKGDKLVERDTGFPYIRVTDFNEFSVDVRGLLFLTAEARRTITRYIINRDDVFISIAGSIGIAGMIPPQLDGANLTENAARLIASNPSQLHPRFLMYWLASDHCQSEIRAQTVKNAQPKLALARIKSLKLPLPALDEQVDVTRALDLAGRKAEFARAQRDLLQDLFRTLLHELMTANTRVHELEVTA